jgi:hypothetical protein
LHLFVFKRGNNADLEVMDITHCEGFGKAFRVLYKLSIDVLDVFKRDTFTTDCEGIGKMLCTCRCAFVFMSIYAIREQQEAFYLTTAPVKLLTLQTPPLSVTSFPTLVFGSSPSLLNSLTTPASKPTSKSAVVVKPG